MAEVKVFTMDNKESNTIQLSDSVFGVTPNMSLIHQAVVRQLANRRVGTHSTKTRAEVRGGGRKPWKQKGTGRARQGSTRSPQWVGGGIVFGPKPRDYSQKMPQKMRRLALCSALSLKLREESMIVIDSIEFSEYKTRNMAQFIRNFTKENEKTVVVVKDFNNDVHRIARNIYRVNLMSSGYVNVYDLMWADKIIIASDAAKKLEEVFG